MLKKLSIIIPCYNEDKLICKILDKIDTISLDYDMEKEIIVVDDASDDKTTESLESYRIRHSIMPLKTFRHIKNMGKGAAIRTGLEKATGDIIIIQDADMEYDPRDYNKLLQPIAEGYADVVYGSRFLGNGPHRVLFFFHTIGNNLLTLCSNIFTGLNITDMETGYKMFRSEIFRQITLRENRFGFEPEITAKISRIRGIRIYEVGIAYYGRTYEEGKKIKWTDGVRAIYCILKYNLIFRK